MKMIRLLLGIILVFAVFCIPGIEVSAAEKLNVEFESTYAEVGEELSIVVEGATDFSCEWKVSGKTVADTDTSYTPKQEDLEKWIEVTVSDGNNSASAKLYCSKLPVVYINTENNAPIVSKTDYINATMKIQGNREFSAEKILYDGDIEIRGRGNTTWGMPKKPYKIKLDKKADAFGMGKNKHWVLLANYGDESLMRNTLTYEFSGKLGMEHMSTVWVDVIMNGEYIGNYQFCEQIRVDETRVDIFDWESFAEDSAEIIAEKEGIDDGDLADYMLEEDMSWITSGKVTFEGKTYNISDYPEIKIPNINGGYLLELDEYYDEVSKFKTAKNQPIMFKNPEFVNTNKDMISYVQEYVQAFENAVRSDNYMAVYEGNQTHYKELFDFNALVDYWLINEIFYNEELNKKSTYMHKDIDGLMMMGPMWDMDHSSGGLGDAYSTNNWATLSFNKSAQINNWYKSLVKDPYFLMKAQERYWEIHDEQLAEMIASIDVYYEKLKESGDANSAIWLYGKSFEANVSGLKEWFDAHLAWLDENMKTEESLAKSFFSVSDSLELSVLKTDGTEMEKDTSMKAPADGVIFENQDIILNVTGNRLGTAELYLNGKLLDSKKISAKPVSYEIKADMLLENLDEKNVIEVKIRAVNGTISARNYITVKVKACPHENASIVDTIEPTCTESGSCEKVCQDCGNIVTKEILSLGHSFSTSYVIDKAATATANGSKSKHCKRSGCDEVCNVTTIYKASNVKLEKAALTYNGKMRSPKIVVKDTKGNVIGSDNYTITKPSGRKNVGKYTYTIKFKNQYSGTKNLTLTINPKGTSLTSLAADGKSVTVKWKKQSEKMAVSRITGYQIQYSTSKKFVDPKIVTVTGYNKTSKKIKKLSADETYYVRIQTYKTVNGTKYCSGWSSVKSVKTK